MIDAQNAAVHIFKNNQQNGKCVNDVLILPNNTSPLCLSARQVFVFLFSLYLSVNDILQIIYAFCKLLIYLLPNETEKDYASLCLLFYIARTPIKS